MPEYKVNNCLRIKNIIKNYDVNQNSWSIGKDGNEGVADPLAFVILEEIYSTLGIRPNYSSIKYIRSLSDEKAYHWHVDSDNPNEFEIETVTLVYLLNSENSKIEFSDGIYNVKPYDMIIFKKNVIHRAIGKSHGPLIKYTFL